MGVWETSHGPAQPAKTWVCDDKVAGATSPRWAAGAVPNRRTRFSKGCRRGPRLTSLPPPGSPGVRRHRPENSSPQVPGEEDAPLPGTARQHSPRQPPDHWPPRVCDFVSAARAYSRGGWRGCEQQRAGELARGGGGRRGGAALGGRGDGGAPDPAGARGGGAVSTPSSQPRARRLLPEPRGPPQLRAPARSPPGSALLPARRRQDLPRSALSPPLLPSAGLPTLRIFASARLARIFSTPFLDP